MSPLGVDLSSIGLFPPCRQPTAIDGPDALMSSRKIQSQLRETGRDHHFISEGFLSQAGSLRLGIITAVWSEHNDNSEITLYGSLRN